MALLLAFACGRAEAAAPKVYFTKEITPESLVRVYEALERRAEGENVAVKISTGEPGSNYLKPELIKDLVERVDGSIVECNTAYGGARGDTFEHMRVALEHGYTGIAYVDILDADGSMALPVKNGKHLKNVCPGVRLREFSEETFVILKKGNYSHSHSMELCKEAGFVPKVKIYPDQMITSYNMSRAGMGISLIPDLLIYASPESGKCVYYKLLDASSLRRLCIGFKKNRYMSRAVEAFIKTALEVYGK